MKVSYQPQAYNRPVFGYNAQYHTTVKNRLEKSKQNPELSAWLAQCDEMTLRIEDKLLEMEKSKKTMTSQGYKALCDYLVDLKQTVAFHIASNFQSLKFPEREIEQYLNELSDFAQKPDYSLYSCGWRGKVLAMLASFSVKDYSDKFKNLNVKYNNSKLEAKQLVEDIRKQAVDEAKQKEEEEILTLFEKTASSPEGFCDVAGMEEFKAMLQEEIIDYVQNPNLAEEDFLEYGIRMPRGFLFYGPPGCGKTYIVQALAQEAGLKMYKMDVSKIASKFVNQTSINVGRAFDDLKARAALDGKPVILFIDEADSLAFERGSQPFESGENSKTTSTLLKRIESARDDGIIVIAATNKYDMLDEALRQRFDAQKYFPLPDEKLIAAILVKSLSNRKKGLALASNTAEIQRLSAILSGYSNRQITHIIDKAAKIAKNNSRGDITSKCIEEAIQQLAFSKVDEKKYRKSDDTKKAPIGFHKLS